MSQGVIYMVDGDGLRRMTPSAPENENRMQALVAQYPELITDGDGVVCIASTRVSLDTLVAAFREGATFRVIVALTLAESGENVLYTAPPVEQREVQQAVEEALNFAESMGFILESGWAGLDPTQKEETLRRMTAFHAPEQKDVPVPAERPKPVDALSTVARLFAAFALLAAAASFACSGVTAEQRRRSAEIHYDLGTNLLANSDVQGALKAYQDARQKQRFFS